MGVKAVFTPVSNLLAATQSAVARLAGVDRSTVSHVLSGRPTRISAEVAERVRRAAAELRYTPNRHARALLTGRTRSVGVLIPTPWHSQGWVWSRIVVGFQQALFEKDYAVLLHGAAPGQAPGLARELLRQRRIDGVLFLGNDRIDWKKPPDAFPAVAVDLGVGHRCPIIYQDSAPGIREAASHLFELGHRRFLWLGPSQAAGIGSGDRERALAAFCEEKGLSLGLLKLSSSLRQAGQPTPDNLRTVREELAKHLPGLGDATAVVCWNDPLAACLCQVLQDKGVGVPEQISVVGFDDLQPSLVHPSLSTVSGAYPEMGAAAADLLLALIENRETARRIAVPTWFIPRESTGPAKTTPESIRALRKEKP